MKNSSSLFCSLIIALLASFTIITIYYSIVFFLRNRLLWLTATGSEESPWSSTGVDIESSPSSHSHVCINNSRGVSVAGGTDKQKCAAACLSKLEYGDTFRLFPWRIKELKTMDKIARGHENDKIAFDGDRGSWTAALFWWAAIDDSAIVI